MPEPFEYWHLKCTYDRLYFQCTLNLLVFFVLDIVLNTEQSKETLLVHVSKENYPFYKCMVISFNNLKHVQDELQIITKPEVFWYPAKVKVAGRNQRSKSMHRTWYMLSVTPTARQINVVILVSKIILYWLNS